jgi:hypothetical protein
MKLTRRGEKFVSRILFIFLLVVLILSFAWGILQLLEANHPVMTSLILLEQTL